MNRSIKTFLVWLLMAILPLHAMAASVGMSCVPGQRQLSQQVETVAASHHGMHHDMRHNVDAGMHAHHGAQASDAGAADASKHAAHDKAEQQTHSSCSACSMLCIGAAAPPSAFLAVPSFDGTDAFLISPAALVPGFIPDGLQRPPRPHVS
ncbi:hypothetical protein [Massilia suwonensis]|uniref:DUF2946 domain-containing protein n=1 Tax=Massilia suwonensis TaxID=648895 RepID=A0ABW0MS17_9BURK